jgi:damage-control phosphatase, subfamily I
LKIGPDCVPCILKMCLGFIRKTGMDNRAEFKLFDNVMKIPSLKGQDWNVTSPDVIEKVMHITYDMLGNKDPLRKEKADLNRYLLDRYDAFETMVQKDRDPLKIAVQLAILGNSIDIMLSDNFSHLQSTIRDKMKYPLPEAPYQQMKGQLANTRRLVYFGDNAGEIVLDKLLISTLKELYNLEVTFVVRSMPTLNDVTLKDARDVKMNGVARVLENGIEGPFPGTRVFRCSPEIQDIFKQADLVISKGGGNFDSLDEDKKIYGQKISFLFLSKCYLYEKYLQTPLEAPILSNYYD